jgi:hypothetical protein
MRWLAILTLLFSPLLAAQEAVSPERLNTLVTQLGSDDWATRERASRELIGIGEPARDTLEAALTHEDAEVRARVSNALIQIGESFARSVQCASSAEPALRDHGRASLMQLFRLGEARNLRELAPWEYQPRYGWNNENTTLQGFPSIALLRLQLLGGLAVVVSPEIRERWAKVLSQGAMHLYLSGDSRQVYWVRQALIQGLQNTGLQNSADGPLLVRPMRIGRATFLYITSSSASRDISRRCADNLLDNLLAGGTAAVEAAWLLGLAAAGETESIKRVRAEYIAEPGAETLMWLALSMGDDAAVAEAIRKRDHSGVPALLKGESWIALQACERYFLALSTEARGKLLSPVIESSNSTIEATVAISMARGAPIEPAARARLATFLGSTEDALAAAAVGWLASVENITDDELQAVWKAAATQKLESSFLLATLELVQRPGVGERLAERARAALSQSDTEQALAAAVLTGRAGADDFKVALAKLKAARNKPRLSALLAGLLKDCSELPEDAITAFVSGLIESDAELRRLFMAALSGCKPDLRLKIAEATLAKLPEMPPPRANPAGDPPPAEIPPAPPGEPAPPKPASTITQAQKLAWLSLTAVRAGAGNAEALELLWQFVRGDDVELAKAAAASLNDAIAGDDLFKALKDLQTDQTALHGVAASQAGCLECARRAAQAGNRDSFRRAQTIALAVQNQESWRIQNDLARYEAMMNAANIKPDAGRLLPRDLLLRSLTIDGK